MFNFGSDEKEGLEENMEEIKDMIQDGKKEGSRPLDEREMKEEVNDESGDLGESDMGNSNSSMSGSSLSQQDRPEVPSLQDEGGNEQETGNNGPRQPERDQIINDGDSGDNLSLDRQNQDEEKEKNTKEPQQRKGPDINQGNQGTLFLKEEEFRNVRERLEEMNYLTQEMQSSVDSLRNNVRREQDTSQNAKELMDSFEERRSEIESTIESGQK